MGYFDSWFGSQYLDSWFDLPVIGTLTGAVESIRDRIIALISAATPTVMIGDRFGAHSNEDDGDFVAWAESAPPASFRRFQVRDTGDDEPPAVAGDVEWRTVTFEITTAYPQTSRAGKDGALDRDDLMRLDQELGERTYGLRAAGNFTGLAAWLGSDSTRVVGNGVDFLVIRQRMGYWLVRPAAAALVPTMNPTTLESVRDRVITVIESLAPTVLAGDRFERYQNERNADFIAWSETAAAGALRRFQVRDLGSARGPDVTDARGDGRFVILQVVVAYPQTSRTGPGNALDRDDLMRADQNQIEQAIGVNGGANFTGTLVPNAAWVDGSTSRVIGNGVDYLVIRQTMRFQRTYP